MTSTDKHLQARAAAIKIFCPANARQIDLLMRDPSFSDDAKHWTLDTILRYYPSLTSGQRAVLAALEKLYRTRSLGQ